MATSIGLEKDVLRPGQPVARESLLGAGANMQPRATLVLLSPWKQTSGMTAAKVRYGPN